MLKRTKELEVLGSELAAKMQDVERGIKKLVKRGGTKFSDYAMVIGDKGEFDNLAGPAGEQPRKVILDRIGRPAREAPDCLKCSWTNTASVWYGEFGHETFEKEKREEVWLAGCCIPEPRMEWHYFHCGKDWR